MAKSILILNDSPKSNATAKHDIVHASLFLYIRVSAWRLASVRQITAASMKLIWASPHKISYE